jgi:hypothetical protein
MGGVSPAPYLTVVSHWPSVVVDRHANGHRPGCAPVIRNAARAQADGQRPPPAAPAPLAPAAPALPAPAAPALPVPDAPAEPAPPSLLVPAADEPGVMQSSVSEADALVLASRCTCPGGQLAEDLLSEALLPMEPPLTEEDDPVLGDVALGEVVLGEVVADEPEAGELEYDPLDCANAPEQSASRALAVAAASRLSFIRWTPFRNFSWACAPAFCSAHVALRARAVPEAAYGRVVCASAELPLSRPRSIACWISCGSAGLVKW